MRNVEEIGLSVANTSTQQSYVFGPNDKLRVVNPGVVTLLRPSWLGPQDRDNVFGIGN